jgi:proteasome lid subunit RPN8/RPN11
MANFSSKILNSIRRHSLSNREEESCGVIFNYEAQHFFPMPNSLSSPDSFALDSKVYLLKDRIAAIVHSHPYADAYPSPADEASSRGSGIPFLIYSCLYNNFLYFDHGKCKPLKE